MPAGRYCIKLREHDMLHATGGTAAAAAAAVVLWQQQQQRRRRLRRRRREQQEHRRLRRLGFLIFSSAAHAGPASQQGYRAPTRKQPVACGLGEASLWRWCAA